MIIDIDERGRCAALVSTVGLVKQERGRGGLESCAVLLAPGSQAVMREDQPSSPPPEQVAPFFSADKLYRAPIHCLVTRDGGPRAAGELA